MSVSEVESVCLSVCLSSSPPFRRSKEDRAQEVPAGFQLQVLHDGCHTEGLANMGTDDNERKVCERRFGYGVARVSSPNCCWWTIVASGLLKLSP